MEKKLNIKSAEKAGRGRLAYLDVAKGLCMLWIVAHHSNLHVWVPNVNGFFFIIAGCFFSASATAGAFWQKRVNRLVIPYLFFIALTFAVLGVSRLVRGAEGLDFGFLFAHLNSCRAANNPLWFLVCLFSMNVLFFAVTRVFKTTAALIASVTALAAVGFAVDAWDVHLPMYIVDACQMMPYFLLGFLLNPVLTSLRAEVAFGSWRVFAGGAVVFAVALVGAWLWLDGMPDWLVRAAWFVESVGGFAVLMCVSVWLSGVWLLNFIGRGSLIVFGTHALFVNNFADMVFRPLGMSGVWVDVVDMAATVAVCAFLVAVFKRYVPWLVGESDMLKTKAPAR